MFIHISHGKSYNIGKNSESGVYSTFAFYESFDLPS